MCEVLKDNNLRDDLVVVYAKGVVIAVSHFYDFITEKRLDAAVFLIDVDHIARLRLLLGESRQGHDGQ